MRRSRRTLAILAAALFGGAGAGHAVEPNLLIITIDTLRADRLSCYSRAFVATPAVDALAARGALFERAFAHCPSTLPSHTNIMTGMTPLYHGVHENSKSKVPADCLTIADYLKAKGYATGAFIGAFPLNARFGLDKGFDTYDDRLPARPAGLGTFAERKAAEVVAPAMAWLAGQSGKWFCWIHLWDPHAPYAPPEPFLGRYRDDPYSGEAAYVDAELALVFKMLEDKGLSDKTLIVLTADHGESLGEHGELTHSYFAYNSTIHVPLIISGPGARPCRIAGNVSHIDIFPTVCELLGLDPPRTLQGRSLVPQLKGAPAAKEPVIYFESLEPYLNERCAPLRGFIEGRMKFMQSPVPEVYDLGRDPGEASNLAAATDLAPLRKKLDGLMASLSSPPRAPDRKAVDPQTLERLRSLGYVTSPVAQLKSSYGPQDDLKNFLPYQQKLEQAILLLDKGDIDESARRMADLAKEKPSFVPAFIYLSQVRRAQGRPLDAAAVLEDGVRSNPDDYTLLSALATALIQVRQWDRASEVLQRALEMIDYDPEVWDNLGIVAMKKEDFPKALEYFEKAVALNKTFALALANIGAVHQAVYFGQGQKAEELTLSIDYLQKAVALDPSFDLAWRGLGVSYWTAGRNDEAIGAWEKAIRLSPQDDFSMLRLGNLYLQKGEKARALALFERCLKIKGDRITPREKEILDALIEQCKR